MSKTTTLVSVASDETQADARANTPSISADGRYVAFNSQASNLLPDATDHLNHIYVHEYLALLVLLFPRLNAEREMVDPVFQGALYGRGRTLMEDV